MPMNIPILCGGTVILLLLATLSLQSLMTMASSDTATAAVQNNDDHDVCQGGSASSSGNSGHDVGGGGEECSIVDIQKASLSSVFVIGDLHGDAICAISWVNRTGLVANLIRSESESSVLPLYERLNDLSLWKWTNDNASLVFMGDYVDKGPTARQTVEFVRNLTIVFPNYVTAILGNHELELLRDRDARIAPAARYSAYSYATVHPGDYHNYIIQYGHNSDFTHNDVDDVPIAAATNPPPPRDLDEKDDLVLDLLYEASMEVYSYNAHSAVRNVPSLQIPSVTTDDHSKDTIQQPLQSDLHTYYRQYGIRYAITDIVPPEHRTLVQERLEEYQTAYLNTYRSGSLLGSWMESRPIAHFAENINTLFVHGGVSSAVGKSYLTNGKVDVDRLNAAWYEHSHESKLYDFLRGENSRDDNTSLPLGEVIYELMTYRGNHPGYANWESHGTYDDDDASNQDEVCKDLNDMLQSMDGIDRIAVGHTPDSDIRSYCDGAFLALDSTLGRWIRGSGNEYCPGPEHHFANRNGDERSNLTSRRSRNGRYTCQEIKEECEGQIVRIDSDGSVNILNRLL